MVALLKAADALTRAACYELAAPVGDLPGGLHRCLRPAAPQAAAEDPPPWAPRQAEARRELARAIAVNTVTAAGQAQAVAR